jgi:membrane peptidoglycan carboxypeptidase
MEVNLIRPVPWWRRAATLVLAALVVLIVVPLVLTEVRSSTFQAQYFAEAAGKLKFWMEPGPSPSIRFPQGGPYDQRLGYSEMPFFLDRMLAKEYRIEAQARFSPELTELIESNYFPPYPEKSQTGLRVLDCGGEPVFSSTYPERVYAHFNVIPPLVVNTLLFIENRELLQTAYPHHNPAVEWGRLGKAVIERAIKVFHADYDAPGGSTLATQIEKYRHSPDGITASIQ